MLLLLSYVMEMQGRSRKGLAISFLGLSVADRSSEQDAKGRCEVEFSPGMSMSGITYLGFVRRVDIPSSELFSFTAEITRIM